MNYTDLDWIWSNERIVSSVDFAVNRCFDLNKIFKIQFSRKCWKLSTLKLTVTSSASAKEWASSDIDVASLTSYLTSECCASCWISHFSMTIFPLTCWEKLSNRGNFCSTSNSPKRSKPPKEEKTTSSFNLWVKTTRTWSNRLLFIVCWISLKPNDRMNFQLDRHFLKIADVYEVSRSKSYESSKCRKMSELIATDD